MKIPNETRKWLLAAEEPYVRYNAELFFTPEKADRNLLLKDPFILENIKALTPWSEFILKSHDTPYLFIHRLALLADLGVRIHDNGMPDVVSQILKDTTDRGIPEISIEIPVVFGGSGKPEKAWMLCDFPTILYALIRMGIDTGYTKDAIKALQEMAYENGYHCQSSFPKLRGPGRKGDMCPYANLVAAKAFSEDKDSIQKPAAQQAVEALLFHWEKQKEKKFFLFGIGTTFRKLKFPMVWYNLLHMLEVISRYKKYHQDRRFQAMIKELLEKTDDSLCFKPESIYMFYKSREFSNKKQASRIITLFILRILKRIGMIV